MCNCFETNITIDGNEISVPITAGNDISVGGITSGNQIDVAIESGNTIDTPVTLAPNEITVNISTGEGGGSQAQVSFETVSKNLEAYDYSLNYNASMISSIVYDLGGGQSITKTLNYTADKLTSITLSGDTPDNIELIKALTYTGDSLSAVTYS